MRHLFHKGYISDPAADQVELQKAGQIHLLQLPFRTRPAKALHRQAGQTGKSRQIHQRLYLLSLRNLQSLKTAYLLCGTKTAAFRKKRLVHGRLYRLILPVHAIPGNPLAAKTPKGQHKQPVLPAAVPVPGTFRIPKLSRIRRIFHIPKLSRIRRTFRILVRFLPELLQTVPHRFQALAPFFPFGLVQAKLIEHFLIREKKAPFPFPCLIQCDFFLPLPGLPLLQQHKGVMVPVRLFSHEKPFPSPFPQLLHA